MKLRGEARGPRGVSRRVACRAFVAAALPLLLLAAAFAAAGCGGSTTADALTSFLGDWERIEGGAPNPDFTLAIVARGDGASVTFANLIDGMRQTVAGTVQDGFIACAVSTADSGAGASPGASATPYPEPEAKSVVQLSLDDDGRLVVDLVLADGTLEPIWVYERAGAVGPSPSDDLSPAELDSAEPSAAGTL